jgi:hypothetical protein
MKIILPLFLLVTFALSQPPKLADNFSSDQYYLRKASGKHNGKDVMIQKEYYIIAYLKDASIVRGSSFIYTENKKDQFLEIDSVTIKPWETDSIIIDAIIGIPMYDKWAFRVLHDKISLFSNLPEPRMRSYTHLRRLDYNIEEYNYSNLRYAVSGNSNASTILANSRRKFILSIGMFVVGLACIISPIPEVVDNGFSTARKFSMIGGAGLCLASWYTNTNVNYYNCVFAYNNQ